MKKPFQILNKIMKVKWRSHISDVISFILLVSVSGCSVKQEYTHNQQLQTSSEKLNSAKVISPPQAIKSQIRGVDFCNFTYPILYDDNKPTKETFTLRNGVTESREYTNMGIIYGDINNDKSEEAIVRISILSGGSAMPNDIYIYTLDNNRPKLFWSFTTGDRADGGYRALGIADGKLIMELYNPKDAKGACCPQFYDRIYYQAQNNKLKKYKRIKEIPNPEGHGSPTNSFKNKDVVTCK